MARPPTGNWLLGEAGESCHETCARAGATCNVCGMRGATEAMAKEAGALNDLHKSIGCDDLRYKDNCQDPDEPIHPSKDVDRCCWQGNMSTCEGARGSVRRLCCCGEGACDTSVPDIKDLCVSPCKIESDGSCNCQPDVSTSKGYMAAVTLPVVLAVAAGRFVHH